MKQETQSAGDWEQVSILVAQEEAGRAESLLTEILPGALVIEKEYGDLFPNQLDQYRGPVRLRGYYQAEKGSHLQKRIRLVLEQAGLEAKPVFSHLVEEDWATAWQRHYQPIPVGKKLIIVPSWLENPDPERLVIWMDPGRAFGSGTHPTTQLCLELLEIQLAREIPEKMLDIGCGSGILSIAGAKLGVPQVLGVDLDPDAIRSSFQNAAANQVTKTVDFRQGTVPEILAPGSGFGVAPLVVANIIAPILRELFQQGLANLVCEGGALLLSGILEDQLPDLLEWLDATGFSLVEQRQLQEWVALVGIKSPL